MSASLIATVGAVAFTALPPRLNFNHFESLSIPRTAVYEITSTHSAATSEWKFSYNYIEEKFSLRDAANLLAKESRGFSLEEATAYKAFIDDFFI